MVIVFRAFHIYIWVAFVGFFLPLVVAFTSRNAARFSFLETQDCIRHRRIPPFFRRVTVLWGDSGDGGDSSFGIPPADCRNCHPHPLHDGHVDDDGVLGYPPRKSRHRHAAILLSEAVRRRIAGHSPALRESRGNVWHTTLQGKV